MTYGLFAKELSWSGHSTEIQAPIHALYASREIPPPSGTTPRRRRIRARMSRETIWSSSTPLRHMPQLDGLRACAVAMVVCYHFYRPIRSYIHLGGIGVRVFFVLSGFLITGILLKSRFEMEASGGHRGHALRRFYIRRVLRIFPLYYFALAIAWLGKVADVRPAIAWHAAYLSNVYFFLENSAHPGHWGGQVSHLWSLAVEEQFYLLWPWIILFARRRWLPGIALAFAALGPVFRLVVTRLTGNDITPVLLPGCIDSLALGAYLAMTVLPEFEDHPLVRPVGPAVLWAGVALLAANLAAQQSGGYWDFQIVSFDMAIAVLGLWLVARASRGIGGFAGQALGWGPIRYIGTISYGIYVYHLLIPALLPKLARRFGRPDLFVPLGDQTLGFLLFYACVTVLVAALSWHLFEAPINRLKARFEYR
jgi:peptidoglycan/LPS O-acetylase OafA/YrhL